MRGNGWGGAGLLVLLVLSVPRTSGAKGSRSRASGRCVRVVVEGEVRAGQGFRKSFGGGLDLVLEPIASGWVVRVVPAEGPRPKEDYAEIATPPYRSVSPLLLSTDFRFRAQDAVGWNPRRFRYAADARAFERIEGVYRRVTATKTPAAGDEAALAELVASQPEGVFEILDASLVPGTADPTRAAALVATHFGTTAHRTEPPEGGRATALGRIGWVRFRVKLDLLRGVRSASGVGLESYACGRG